MTICELRLWETVPEKTMEFLLRGNAFPDFCPHIRQLVVTHCTNHFVDDVAFMIL